MGPTIETRSHDEWLAEVKRRGGRLRRRRQLAMAVVGAVALVLPVSVLTTLLDGDADRDVSQLVAGPGRTTSPAGDIAPSAEIGAGSAGEIPFLEPTTTTVMPASPGPVTAPADDPVVRTVPTTVGITAMQSAPTTTVAAEPPEPAPAPCIASEFRVTVTMEQDAYRPGDTVSGSSVLEKLSPGKCLVPDWFLQISFLNDAGKDVTEIALVRMNGSTDEQYAKWYEACGPNRCPRWVEKGAVRTETFAWETLDCSNYPTGPIVPVPGDTSYCRPFPAGTYTVVANWTGPGSGPPGRATVKLGA